MYTSPLSTLISSLSLNHHLYADDTTFPVFSPAWLWLICYSSSKCSATHILLEIANLLTLNSSKTEFLLIGLQQQLTKIQNCSLNTTDSARNLGLIFDSHLTFSDQISSLSKSCYYHIRELRCIRPYLDFKTASTIATSIVHSKLDYCNSLYNTESCTFQNLKQIVFRLFRTLLPGLWFRLPNSVTSPLFSNLYIGLKSRNALNINFFLLPLLNLLICTAWSLFSPLGLLAPHLLSPFLDHLHLLL